MNTDETHIFITRTLCTREINDRDRKCQRYRELMTRVIIRNTLPTGTPFVCVFFSWRDRPFVRTGTVVLLQLLLLLSSM